MITVKVDPSSYEFFTSRQELSMSCTIGGKDFDLVCSLSSTIINDILCAQGASLKTYLSFCEFFDKNYSLLLNNENHLFAAHNKLIAFIELGFEFDLSSEYDDIVKAIYLLYRKVADYKLNRVRENVTLAWKNSEIIKNRELLEKNGAKIYYGSLEEFISCFDVHNTSSDIVVTCTFEEIVEGTQEIFILTENYFRSKSLCLTNMNNQLESCNPKSIEQALQVLRDGKEKNAKEIKDRFSRATKIEAFFMRVPFLTPKEIQLHRNQECHSRFSISRGAFSLECAIHSLESTRVTIESGFTICDNKVVTMRFEDMIEFFNRVYDFYHSIPFDISDYKELPLRPFPN